MPERRRYTKAQKARAVGLALLTSTEAAAETEGIPRTTLIGWMGRVEYDELRQKSSDAVADEMWAVIQMGVAEIAKGLRDPDAALRDKVIAVGVLYDKRALLTGAATSRTESRDITGTISDLELAEALRTADALTTAGRAAPTPPVEAEG